METTAAAKATVLRPADIVALREEALGRLEGVRHRVLWTDDTSIAGVLTVEGGHHLGEHAHRENHHHFWVLDGEAVVLGSVLGAGSYVHVPSGLTHDIDARETGGCTVFYLYVRQT